MRKKRYLIVTAVVAILGVGCGDAGSGPEEGKAASNATASSAPAAPQSFTVIVDGPSKLGAENYVLGTYFPSNLEVRPGDTITYDNRSSNDIHTVTLGVKSDRSDAPPTLTPSRQVNPAVFGPCYSSETARPDIACTAASHGGPPEYAGKGFWNSGVIMPTALPAEAGPKQASVKLAAGIAAGPYTVTCLLHPNMEQVVTVVGSDAERQSPAEVAATAGRELAALTSQAAGLTVPALGPGRDGASVVSGWGDKLLAVNRFDPPMVTVKSGQRVTWKTASPWMPHTVSFQAPFKSPAEPNALLPAGVESGGRFAGGESHSGIFGPPPDGRTDTFSLTFTKAGKYPYVCLLHPGMAGTVEVS